MRNKKLIILIVLGIAAIFSLIYGIVTPTKLKRELASKPTGIQKEETVTIGKRIILTSRRTKRTDYPSWVRSPFILPPVKKLAELKLNGIVWDEEAPQAIINDNIVGIGAKVVGVTIIDIKEDKVILNDGTRDFELRLGHWE